MTDFNLAADTYVNQDTPTKNFATAGKLAIRGTGTSHVKKAYLGLVRPFPLGVNIVTAFLVLYRSGAWTGTKTVKVSRVTGAWKVSTLDFAPLPAVDTTHQGSLAANAGADKSQLLVDITALMQDISNGSPFTGLEISLTEDAEVAVRSKDGTEKTLVPILSVDWTTSPVIPSNGLQPTGGQSVSTSTPRLTWGYQDADDQGSYQVQVSTNAISADVYDSGQVNSSDHFLDASGHFTIAAAVTRYWRVQVWDSAGNASGFSAWQQFTRTDLSTLSLGGPGATTDDLTPTVAWTFGGAQTRWQVIVEHLNAVSGIYEPWVTLSGNDTSASVAVPDVNAIQSLETYRVTVNVWDNVARAYDDHKTVSQVFTYVRSGAPAAVSALTVTPIPGTPGVTLAWTATLPDYFTLKVDGREVLPRIDPGLTLVSGSNHQMVYFGAKPRVSHTFEIERVVISAGVQQNSAGNPIVSATTRPIGVFLVDDTTNVASPTYVQILGDEDASMDLGESAATFYPVGSQSPVRIYMTQRGYEGSLSGFLDNATARDNFLKLWNRKRELKLIMGDVTIPIRMEGASAAPTPSPDSIFSCSFSFFQSGAPWPS